MSILQYSDLEMSILLEYEDILIGKRFAIDASYFEGQTTPAQEHLALAVIQYACETYLRWSPEKMYHSLTPEILMQWSLLAYIKYVRFPRELDPLKNLWYIATLVYPTRFYVNNKAVQLQVYKNVLAGTPSKFPAFYFQSDNAANKLCVFLKYAIENYLQYDTVEQLYDIFGTKKATKFLRTYKLAIPIKDCFDAPVTALHYILSTDQQRPLLYHCYRFNWLLYNQRRAATEKRGKKKKTQP